MERFWFPITIGAILVLGAIAIQGTLAQGPVTSRKPLAPMKLLLRDGKTVVTVKESATGVQIDISNLQVR